VTWCITNCSLLCIDSSWLDCFLDKLCPWQPSSIPLLANSCSKAPIEIHQGVMGNPERFNTFKKYKRLDALLAIFSIWQFQVRDSYTYTPNNLKEWIRSIWSVLPCDSYAKCGICRRRVSVCLCVGLCVCVCVSVILRYCIKTAKRRITQITPHDSPVNLVFWHQSSRRNWNGITPDGGDKCRRGGLKFVTFDEKRAIYFENGTR